MTVLLALHAMATRFELVLHGDDPVRLRAAGEEALGEIERLERRLSFYRDDSEITEINRRAAEEPVRVSGEVLRLLRRCADVHASSDGAFDITIGPLMGAWRFTGAGGGLPDSGVLDAARAVTGFHLVELDDDARTVRFRRAGVAIDLGAAGKGFAVDAAVDVLRELGVTCALLHGGTSSVHAIGAPPGEEGWRIAVGSSASAGRDEAPPIVVLRDGALAVSAARGKAFEHGGRLYGHVIDPRTGEPVSHTASAAVTGPSSFLCDALSTALMVNGPAWLPALSARWPGYEGSTR